MRAVDAEEPSDHIILPEIISKEPLGPAVNQNDPQWADVVRWTLFALINAEELGVTSKNVDQMLTSPNPEIRRLLGLRARSASRWGLPTIGRRGRSSWSAITARFSSAMSGKARRSGFSGGKTLCGRAAACNTRRPCAEARTERSAVAQPYTVTPWWRSRRVRGLLFQAALVAAIAFAVIGLVEHVIAEGGASGFGFLNTTAGFDIVQHLIPYSETSTYGACCSSGF